MEKRGQKLFIIYICRLTGRFMVWVNGKQNLERENCALESRLSFCTNQAFAEKWL